MTRCAARLDSSVWDGDHREPLRAVVRQGLNPAGKAPVIAGVVDATALPGDSSKPAHTSQSTRSPTLLGRVIASSGVALSEAAAMREQPTLHEP